MNTLTNNQELTTISPAGEGFVKTATAAPDFELSELEGIPDNYNGPSVVKKDYVFLTVTAAAGKATYFVVTPTAGVAYYTPQFAPVVGVPLVDGNVLVGQYYPDAVDLFPGCGTTEEVSNTEQLSKGRLMSMSAELNCVTNAFNQYGTISCWKTPLNRTTAALDQAGFNVTDNLVISGCKGISTVALDSQAYVSPVRNGVYSVSMNRQEEFNFYPILDEVNTATETNARFRGTESLHFAGAAPIFDNGFDSIIFRIDVPPNTTDQSFVLKLWKVWEYQPTFNSLLYNFSHLSPDVDPGALALYREMCRHLPTAVRDKDNPDFWNTILSAVGGASSLLSKLPGPIGTAASGVHAISELVTKLKNRGSTSKRRTTPKVTIRPSQKRNNVTRKNKMTRR
jgi:hypothetical protein